MRVSLALLALLLFASGCAKREEAHHIQTDTLAEARAIAQRTSVTCAAPDQCHPAVAMLAMASEEGASVCTGFLVAPDVLATNSHCIPSEIKAAGASCENFLWAFFPALGTQSAERVDCAQVLSLSNSPYTNAPDFAFVRLSRAVKREALSLDPNGVPGDERGRLIRVDPYRSDDAVAFVGEMGRETCRAVKATIAAPFYRDPRSPVVTVTDCELRPGNSGSPILGSNGAAWSIAHAILLHKSELLKPLDALKLENFVAPINIATNFACVSYPGRKASAPLPASCAVDFARFQDVQESLNYMFADANAIDPDGQAKRAVGEAMTNHFRFRDPSAFEWEGLLESKMSDTYYASAVPRCFKYRRDLDTTFFMPRWKVISGINPFYQKGYKAVERNEDYLVTLKTTFPHYSMTLSTFGGRLLDSREGDLPECATTE